MLAQKIKRRMKKLDLTQAELARRADMRTGHIAEIVNGKRGKEMSIGTVQRLCGALEVEPDFFYPNSAQRRVRKTREASHKRTAAPADAEV